MMIRSDNLEHTYVIAQDFVKNLKSYTASATVIGLSGDLGSGKTSFTQGVLKALGVTQHVTSPTFVIEKRYVVNHEHFDTLIHIDAYRLKDGRELEILNWKETVSNPRNLILIEWPEQVQSALPENIQLLKFKFIDRNIREIEY